MRPKPQLTSVATVASCALLMLGCPLSSEVVQPPVVTWDRCLSGQLPIRRKVEGARVGTAALGDAGCEWLTVESDGGTRVARRRRIFGNLTLTAPDVRLISEQVDSRLASFEWFDGDGDGRHEFEERATFDDAGTERTVEQTFLTDAGVPYARTLLSRGPGRLERTVNQLFLDGGWQTTSQSDFVPPHTHETIVPIRVPGQ
jgi:hypothetical protein